jgi:hypothetical protein
VVWEHVVQESQFAGSSSGNTFYADESLVLHFHTRGD